MLENLSYLIAIISAICGATFFISKKLVCAERASDKALETCAELEEMTVRDLESAARSANSGSKGRRRKPPVNGSQQRTDPLLVAYEERLRHYFATAVGIHRSASLPRQCHGERLATSCCIRQTDAPTSAMSAPKSRTC